MPRKMFISAICFIVSWRDLKLESILFISLGKFKSDIPFIVDRLGCADDIVVTFTWTDPDLDDIYIGTPGTNSFTIAADTSSILVDLKLKFVAPPGGTGKTGTFTATWVSCGITKIQTYSYSIP